MVFIMHAEFFIQNVTTVPTGSYGNSLKPTGVIRGDKRRPGRA
jgi:hypothetical protein